MTKNDKLRESLDNGCMFSFIGILIALSIIAAILCIKLVVKAMQMLELQGMSPGVVTGLALIALLAIFGFIIGVLSNKD